MNFGERLQQALDEMGISQSELGRRVGATPQSVSGWCQAGILPRKEILEQLPQATGKPLYWFFMDASDELSMQLTNRQGNHSSVDRDVSHLLHVFCQLPTEEQQRFVGYMEDRLKELDNVMAEYLKRRKIDPPDSL
ncbi:helix-turn-helix domain-containing protein [Pectobacterium polaris]|uniref:helix-turn-helix domain-containing protein n=1 Tax=Pectobacterium polaris TaxID=2042057 RepID=UPI001CF32D3C|nr:helix-turn-helix domain-containing protein [Pectobacterium polaris]MCA6954683.1 helix-turn-helix domain-containing protein [Pectobacterium polaris]